MTPDTRAYDARLADLQRRGRLPSIVGAVATVGGFGAVGSHGAPSWRGAAGHAPTPTANTAYRIGSITKTMTAVLVLQQVQAGAVDLADPIGRHVVQTPYADALVGDLLAHTAGLPSEPLGSWWERSAGVDRATLFAAHRGRPRVFEPGRQHHYSNLGYALLGALVEDLSGADWWTVVRERLLEPLTMTSTTYDPPIAAAPGTSIDHFTGAAASEPHTDTGAMAAAGQLWSTTDDLMRWAPVLVGERPDILRPATAALMRHPRYPARDYGLGVRLLHTGGREWVGHTGSMPGFQASLFVEPESCETVVALANATTGLPADEVPAILGGAGPSTPDPLDGPWRPTATLPDQVRGVPGLWFWGNTAYSLEWWVSELRLRDLRSGRVGDRFSIQGADLVGVAGYHHGEVLHVHRGGDGAVVRLECATFVYTRRPYELEVTL